MMMKSSSVPLASLNSRYFEDYSILNYSNHVQSDNKDFSCALGSTVAICTCPPSSAGIGHRKATEIFIKDLLEDEQGLSLGGMLALLKYPFYPLFNFDNGMNLI